VHLVGKFLEGDVAIACWIFQDEFWEGLFKGGFAVVKALELEEIFEKSTPLALGRSD
jgi:hypothetical protein